MQPKRAERGKPIGRCTFFTNSNSWYPVPEHAIILSAIPDIQAIVNRYHQYQWHHGACRRWENRHKQRWQEHLPRRTSIRDWFSQANRSASNALNWGAARKQRETRRRRRWNIWLVIMAIFHLWNERLIFTSEDVPAAEEIFASAAELYSVNSSLSSFLWNYGIAVTFCV